MLASMILPLVRSLSSPTYYFRVGADQPGCAPVQNFDDGYAYGPCGQGNKYGAHSKYWAAIYNAKEHCGKPITLDYNGKKMVLTVADECPGCAADNHVDMGLEALIELTGSAEAACAINRLPVKVSWSFGSYVGSGPVITQVQPKVTQVKALGSVKLVKPTGAKCNAQKCPKNKPPSLNVTLAGSSSTSVKPTATSNSSPAIVTGTSKDRFEDTLDLSSGGQHLSLLLMVPFLIIWN